MYKQTNLHTTTQGKERKRKKEKEGGKEEKEKKRNTHNQCRDFLPSTDLQQMSGNNASNPCRSVLRDSKKTCRRVDLSVREHGGTLLSFCSLLEAGTALFWCSLYRKVVKKIIIFQKKDFLFACVYGM